MSAGDDQYDPVCLHKGGGVYETRVGWCCHRCGMIRRRHSRLVLVPFFEAGGITLLSDVVVPLVGLLGWGRTGSELR